MTENEIINRLHLHGETMTQDEAFFIMDALEEIQQYRAIGTVEHIDKALNIGLKAQVELKDYKAIGTIEDIEKGIKQSEEEFEMLMEYRNIGTVEECREAVAILKQLMKHCEGSCADCHYKNPNGMECMNDLLKLKGGAE